MYNWSILNITLVVLLGASTQDGSHLPGSIQSKPKDQDLLSVKSIVSIGIPEVRRIQQLIDDGQLLAADSNQKQRLLNRAKAELMGVDIDSILVLEQLKRYQGDVPAHDAIFALTRILEQGAANSDYGRAEVLHTLLHIYEELIELPKERREEWKPLGYPQEILIPIVRHEIESEETIVLEKRIHQLLYHDWISNIQGIDKIAIRLINSPYLSATLYEIFYAKMQGTLQGECRPNLSQDKANDHERRMLSRDKPVQWPCLPSSFFLPLWDSPRATAEHREKLHDQLVNVLLAGEANPDLVRACARYYLGLRQRGAISPQQVKRYIDRMVSEDDPPIRSRMTDLPILFPDLCEACPVWRFRNNQAQWDVFKIWWQEQGRNEIWIPPFDSPHSALVIMLVEPEDEGKKITIIQTRLTLQAGITSESMIDSPWGPIEVWVRAWRSPRQDNAWVIEFNSMDSAQKGYYPELKIPSVRYARPGLMWNGTNLRFSTIYAAGNRHAMSVVLVDTTEYIDTIRISDVDSLFAILRKRLPSGELPHGSFPDETDAFLPLSNRLALVDKFLEVVEEDEPRSAWRRSSAIEGSITRVTLFACAQGHESARNALKMWIEKKWPYAKRLKNVLVECEQLLAAAKVDGKPGHLLELLDQGPPQEEVLRMLYNSEFRDSLNEQERVAVARRIVNRGLLAEENIERRFLIIVSLRLFSGENFGYGLFELPEKNAKAIERWLEWAGQER